MSSLQAFFFGMIVAWTPSLVVLWWMLWRDTASQDELGDMQH
jgi:hypothetical protein